MATKDRIVALAAAATLSACASTDAPATTVAYTSFAPDAQDDADEDAESGAEDDDDGPVLDLGNADDAQTRGCTAIDFLFVVDDSSSMAAQQQRLLAGFPGFIDAIASTIEDVDSYHVGVITSDAYAFNAGECRGLGDLVTQTGGESSSARQCGPFAEGVRFATDADDLETVFPCMAQVGTDGAAEERPISALVGALSTATLGAGGCNEGFLRDDAVLVVVIVTDDPPFTGDQDDAHPDESRMAQWHDAVVAAKHGDESAAVVIGFVPWQDLSCLVYAVDSPNLIEFVDSFGDQGVLASVCSSDYASVFASTVATIQSTCEEFVPTG